MCFLSSYEHLKLNLKRIQINILKYGKWLILVYLFQKMSEIANSFSLNLYIIEILCRSIKTIDSCEKYFQNNYLF